MAEINHEILNNEIAQVAVTIRGNRAELARVEALAEQLKEVIAEAEGGIKAFEYLRDNVLVEEEPDEQPNLTTSTDTESVGEEA